MADDPLISVLLPSRGRPDMLVASIASLRNQAADASQVEILVAADMDDPWTRHVLDGLADLHGDAIGYVILQRQGYAKLHAYYQALADRACGDWLLVWNDDAIMVTARWDEFLDRLPPEVMVADLQSQHSPMCCFPAVRAEAVDVVQAITGGFCSDNPHVDSFWEVVGRQSGTLATVPVRVHHDQQAHPHQGNEHGFHTAGHLALMADCADALRHMGALDA